MLRIEPGDLVFNNVFAWEGAAAVAGVDEAGMIGSHRFITYTVNPNKATAEFLKLFFATPGGLELLLKASPGSAGRNKTLGLDRFISQSIPLPPLAEQRRVVARIEELAAQIHEARTLRQQAFDEVRALGTRLASEVFNRAVEKHPIRPLADLVAIRGGGTPSKSNPFFWEGAIPWITPKDMKRRELSDAIDHISELAMQESTAKLIEPGAVLVVVRGMILVHTFPSAVLRVPATINQDMKALTPKKDLLPEYLCALFWACNSLILKLVAKSTHDTRKLETDKLLETTIPVPSLAEQRRIVAELDALQAEVGAMKRLQAETAAELDALLPSILDRAFKGEL